jgi:hypothetical protein
LDIYGILSGWWFQPINLKNMSEESVGMIILFPTVSGKSFKIPWFQTTNQITMDKPIIIINNHINKTWLLTIITIRFP